MNRDEGLEKHMRAHLDLLQWSQLPGHYCLKCVLCVQYLDVCLCTIVSFMHLLCVYMSHCCLRQNKSWTWKHLPGLLPYSWKKKNMSNSNYSWSWHVGGWLNIINRTELARTIVLFETVTTLRKQSMKNVFCVFLGCCPCHYLDKYVCAAMTL